MGQYHFVMNFDRKEFLHPHALGDGLKLLEFACDSCGTMTALAILLAGSSGRGGGDLIASGPLAEAIVGRWAGERIGIVGDYYENGDVRGVDMGPEEMSKARSGEQGWVDISRAVLAVMCEDSFVRRENEAKFHVQPRGMVPAYDPTTDTFSWVTGGEGE